MITPSYQAVRCGAGVQFSTTHQQQVSDMQCAYDALAVAELPLTVSMLGYNLPFSASGVVESCQICSTCASGDGLLLPYMLALQQDPIAVFSSMRVALQAVLASSVYTAVRPNCCMVSCPSGRGGLLL